VKHKNRYLIGGFIVILIALFSVFGLASAWGTPDESERTFGPRKHGRCFNRGPGSKNVTEFIMWRIEKKIKELDLSDDQMEEFNAIQKTLETRINHLIDERKLMMDEFYKEINKEEPDLKILKGSMKEKIVEMSRFMDETLELIFGFYENLDQDQKAKVLEDIREKFEGYGK